MQAALFHLGAPDPPDPAGGRKVDPIFDVLAEIYYPDGVPTVPASIRKDLNAVAKGFRDMSAVPEEIRDAFKAARAARERGDAAYDAAPGFALLKHFGRFREKYTHDLRRRFLLFRQAVRDTDESLTGSDPITYLAWLTVGATADPPQLVGPMLEAARKDYTRTILNDLGHWSADDIKEMLTRRIARIKGAMGLDQ